jgi:pimeloyl-ACP methyl ester carboxylesterase
MIKLSSRLQWLVYLIGALLIAHAKILDELNPLLALIIGLTLMCSAIVIVYCLMLPLGFGLAYLARNNKTALEQISEVPIPMFSTLKPWQWVLVIIDEILLSLKIFLIYQPWFENKRLRTIDCCNNSITNEPVLLIHGFMCNAGAWKQVHQFIGNLDVTSYAMNLEPPLASIDDYAEQIHFAITKIKQITSTQQVKVLAHSMGGIALRAYVRKFGEHHISSAITLGSPHHGTALAAFGMGKMCVK